MRLGALRRHWERLGRRDPCWAALTHPDKRGGGWDLEQFFRSGTEEVAATLERAARLGLTVSRHRALDFGCGAGRVTQALSDAFERVDGVDISASMLDVAARHNRRPERCSYLLNAAPDLALFADASFSFVYSTLVLQHMEPRYSKSYILELLRVLAPGGVLVFQIPSHRVKTESSAGAGRTATAGRMPAAACKARIVTERSSLSTQGGELATIHVTVENRSSYAWPALPDAWGHQINVANHWLHDDGQLLQRDDARAPLPRDIAPGSQVDVILYVTAPEHNGAYWLELDLVQENIGWFAERGSETVRIPCHITGGLPGPAPRPAVVEIVVLPEAPPFRERHPRAFDVFRDTGLRDVYWGWRHALDAVRRQRDRFILVPRDRTIWWLRDRAYKPVIPPLINWWHGLSFAPRMEMYCVPQAEVLAVVAQGGGRVVNTDQELTQGGYESCRYWVAKD